MKLEDCYAGYKPENFPSINLSWYSLVSKFNGNGRLLFWSYELSKLVNWMCVEDPFCKSDHLHIARIKATLHVGVDLQSVAPSKSIC